MRPPPAISVVLCTYNRAERLPSVLDAVLGQDEPQEATGRDRVPGADGSAGPRAEGLELVVVDDGSADATPDLLASYRDRRLRVLRRRNGGLCAARNSGAATATGDWTVFLDDDDLPEPGWLRALSEPMADPTVGITCCGGTIVRPDGRAARPADPGPLGEPFGDVVGSYLPGTFAVRRDLLEQAGGYLDGLGAAHQFELFIRLIATIRAHGLTVASQDRRVLRIERRPATERPVVNPRLLYDGTRWILARHPQVFADGPEVAARFEGVVGVAASRVGDWPAARRRLWRSARLAPASPRPWARLALSTVPPLGRRVWGRQPGDWASHDPNEIGVLRQPADGRIAPRGRELFLPWGYRQSPPPDAPGDATGPRGDREAALYRLAARLARRRARRPDAAPVLDVGCGDGTALVAHFPTTPTVGFDQPDTIAVARRRFPDRRWHEGDLTDRAAWGHLAELSPRLVVCAHVIERVDDPVALLHRLAAVSAGAPMLLATPDRARHELDRTLGPPRTPHHRREWTRDELELLLLSVGFTVERTWHHGPLMTFLAGVAQVTPTCARAKGA